VSGFETRKSKQWLGKIGAKGEVADKDFTVTRGKLTFLTTSRTLEAESGVGTEKRDKEKTLLTCITTVGRYFILKTHKVHGSNFWRKGAKGKSYSSFPFPS
jgi:hypothetical protein